MENDNNSDMEVDLSLLLAHNSMHFLGSPAPDDVVYEHDQAHSVAEEQEQEPTLPQNAQPFLNVRKPLASLRRGKKRSSRACASCRTRKVRCNIIAHGAPCSNCRHDEVDCVLPLSRRQRAAKERAVQVEAHAAKEPSSVQVLKLHEDSNPINTQGSESQKIDHTNCAAIEIRSHDPTIDLSHSNSASSHSLPDILPSSSASQCHSPPLVRNSISNPAQLKPRRDLQAPLATRPIQSLPSIPSQDHEFPDERLPILPRVFSNFPDHLDATDLLYLHRRDALTLPSEKLQILLLKAYTEFVHCDMPILDIDELLATIRCSPKRPKEGGSMKQLSFLVFQAVMFAGVEYVGLKALREAGYGSRETAKRLLFSRVKLLYDFDTTTDRHTIIQALLLMSLYQNPRAPLKNHKNAHHYLGLAISLSFSLGINRDISIPASQAHLLQKRKLERRIWWTTCIRDRVLAMEGYPRRSLGRSSRIRKEDSDIEMVKLEDFDLMESEDDDENGTEALKAKRNATSFIEKAKLCWLRDDSYNLPPQFTLNPMVLQEASNLNTYTGTPLYPATNTTIQTPLPQTSTTFSTPSEPEYNLTANSVSSPSLDDDCLTPRDLYTMDIEVDPVPAVQDNGYGVDGEYDDYLEYLKVCIDDSAEAEAKKKGKEKQEEIELERGGGVKAWQLDCEGGRILEV